MFLPATFAAALLFTILSTVCWGSWANTFKATRNYRFEIFYFDYGFGIFLISVVLAFTLGSHAGSPNAFLANLHQATAASLLYAALAEGVALHNAVRFGCATAAISVTRAGTAPSMPQRAEIDALLRQTAASGR